MPAPYRYAVLRVVPRVDRDEFINTGVILYSPERRYLKAQIRLNRDRVESLWPALDIETLERHLGAFLLICTGDQSAGPIAALSQRERFHWLTAPRSTVIQISPVRTGLADDLDAALQILCKDLVA